MSEANTDVMILGATGFVGRLIARHLITHPDFVSGAFTFSQAGRSTERINSVQAELGIDSSKVRIIQVDVLNEEAIAKAIQTTKVVIDVVGPYWKWGRAVARACAKQGVHYLDLTAEPPYMKWMVDECHTLAEQSGTIMIPCCGFDSIPSDASAYLSNKTLKEKSPDATLESCVSAIEVEGGISGGTMDSLYTFMSDVPSELRTSSIKAFAFSPIKGVRQVAFKFIYSLPLYRHITGGYYFMTVCNRLVVQRTWGLAQAELAGKGDDAGAQSRAYGPKFAYTEFLTVPGGKIGGFILSALTLLLGLAVAIPPVRALIKRFGIQPGSGPSEKTMQNGHFVCTNVSTSSRNLFTGKPSYVRSIIRGQGDPGYLLTSMMISECALALVLEKDALPPLAHRGGVLTPMSALGDVLVRRLERTKRFEFESSIVDENGTPA